MPISRMTGRPPGGGEAAHPRRGPAHRRQGRQAAGTAEAVLTSTPRGTGYLTAMLRERALPHSAAFIESCLPRPAKQPPAGRDWIYEITVAQGFGKCGAITRHSASVRSVWYRVTGRLCCCRVVGVHMANPRLVQEAPWNYLGRHDSTLFKNCR